MCANFGDPRSRDHESRHKKKIKNRQNLARKVNNSLIIPKALDGQIWILGSMWVFMNALWKPSLGAPGPWPKCYGAKMGKKLTSLNRSISVITDIDEKWFVVFEHTINHLSFVYLKLILFFLLCIFFLPFFFFLPLSTFKLLSTLYSKFERLEISERTSVRLKSGVPGW